MPLSENPHENFLRTPLLLTMIDKKKNLQDSMEKTFKVLK